MNVERLHLILEELQKEFSQNNLLGLLQEVRDNLANQVNQPQQPVYQQNLVVALENLNNSLEKSTYNDLSPTSLQIIKDLGGSQLFGNSLRESIQEIFNRNQITPAAALDEINVLYDKIVNLKTAIDELISGFEKLNIEKETLVPGEAEIGYSIPRLVIHNKLSSFSKEVAELNFILGTLSEVLTGKKEDFNVKTISSSDFLLYVVIGLQLADVLSNAIEKIINNYKTILEIKVLRNQLKEKGVPESATEQIEEHANTSMEATIKKIAAEVIKEYHATDDKERKNELENATVIALNKIANRIDKGFNIEVRVEPLTSSTDNNPEEVKTINKIQNRSKSLQYINPVGKPILKLDETNKSKK